MRVMLNDERQVRVGTTWVNASDVDWSNTDFDAAIPDFKVRFKCFTSVDEAVAYINLSVSTEVDEVDIIHDPIEPVVTTQRMYSYITCMGLPIFGLPEECHVDGIHFIQSITVRRVTYEPAYIKIEDGKLVAVGSQPHCMLSV